jgi:two-component system, OmpR family, sensor kinase
VRPEPLAAAPLLAGVRDRFAERAARQGRAIRVEAGAVELRADPLRVRQALANLVDNALRHGRGEVVLSAARANGHVELHVRDSGPGFPAAFLPDAFERFSRADEARSRGGTGLGLAIAAAVAEAHGGSAGAANRREGGADVWLQLPDALSSRAHPD